MTATCCGGVAGREYAAPVDGTATFATAKFRLATAATRISAARTRPARSGTARRSATLPLRRISFQCVSLSLIVVGSMQKASNLPPDSGGQRQDAKRSDHALEIKLPPLPQGLQFKPCRLITDGLRSYGVVH
jgi:hypothetical protein